jgi:flagellar motor switch protein FliN/FliY
MSEETDVDDVDLTDFSQQEKPSEPVEETTDPPENVSAQAEDETRSATDLEAVFDVPVNITAVLGRTHMEVADLLKLDSGDVVELDRKVGEAIDIFVNNRLVARGEIVLVEDRLGVTMTEIIKDNAY